MQEYCRNSEESSCKLMPIDFFLRVRNATSYYNFYLPYVLILVVIPFTNPL